MCPLQSQETEGHFSKVTQAIFDLIHTPEEPYFPILII